MKIDKPLISIVMAVYNPNMQWLEQQLCSLNEQSYHNIQLLVLDDCSTKVEYAEICACIKRCVNRFPCDIGRNEINMGSNKTFEKLTGLAKGKYIAYCDQDDIWNEDKLTVLEDLIEKTGALLVCSDVMVIDGEGNITADSITKVRKHHVFQEGSNLGQGLLFKNFVIGCTILIESQTAKNAVPYIDSMVHDHYLALYAALQGNIAVSKETLIRYRIHEDNQTNVMTGVRSKKDYYEKRILPFFNRITEIKSRLKVKDTEEALLWAQARIDYYNGHWKSGAVIWKYRSMNRSTAMFELIMLKSPSFLFIRVIRWIQAGKL